MHREKNGNKWVICPECKVKLKEENLPNHLKNIHRISLEDIDKNSIETLSTKDKKIRKRKPLFLAIIFIVVLSFIIILIFTFFYPSGNINSEGWINSYSPIHNFGIGSNAFWIEHPINNSSLEHPEWVTDGLKSRCVIFVVHRHTCAWCDPQAKRVISLAKKYKDYVNFYDLDIDLGGETAERAYSSLVYDPDGPPHYIALTGIITLVERYDKIEYGWHAWEGDMEESELESWIKDGIYYYSINKGRV